MSISEGEYSKFGELVEAQDPRTLRRYLDYGKRAKSGQGLAELSQWIGKILLDDGQIYTLENRALGFEIFAYERLAALFEELQDHPGEPILVAGAIDKVFLYRQILSPLHDTGQRGGLLRGLRGQVQERFRMDS